jgi:hypothetical protein
VSYPLSETAQYWLSRAWKSPVSQAQAMSEGEVGRSTSTAENTKENNEEEPEKILQLRWSEGTGLTLQLIHQSNRGSQCRGGEGIEITRVTCLVRPLCSLSLDWRLRNRFRALLAIKLDSAMDHFLLNFFSSLSTFFDLLNGLIESDSSSRASSSTIFISRLDQMLINYSDFFCSSCSKRPIH